MTPSISSCEVCCCSDADQATLHAIAAALAEDDLDHAIDLGLLAAEPCAGCDAHCRARVAAARDARHAALAARERYRARAHRLGQRERARAERRDTAARQPAALPPAAAAALARARARAAKP